MVNHKSLNSPAYFILEFYCKPNCQVTKLSGYQIVGYQIVGYQIVRLPNCWLPNWQVSKLLVTKLAG